MWLDMRSSRPKSNAETVDAEKIKKFSSRKFDWIRGIIADQHVNFLQRLVAVDISYCLDRHTYSGSTAQEEIAEHLGCSVRAVQEAIVALERLGHIGVTVR